MSRTNVAIWLRSRQRDVVRLTAPAKTNPEIAEALGGGSESAKSYVSDVFGKLCVARREGASAWWHDEQLLRRRAERLGAGVLAVGFRGVGTLASDAGLLLLGVLLSFPILVQCGDGTGAPIAPVTATLLTPTVSTKTTGTVVLPRFSGNPAAGGVLPVGVEGALVVDGHCVYVDSPGADPARYILAFPGDLGAWDDDARVLVVDGAQYAPGTTVSNGLPGLRVANVVGYPQPSSFWLVPPDPSCSAHWVTFVLSD